MLFRDNIHVLCLGVVKGTRRLATLTTVPLRLGSNPGEDMDVCKCIMPSRHGGILNSRRAANSLVILVEGEERWEPPDYLQGVLPQNWEATELNCSVTCMVLKATANDRRHLALYHDGP
ncbi:cullin-4A [Trichonephila clavipes]|nr:cullin-4A [Trichonephila clavipes]